MTLESTASADDDDDDLELPEDLEETWDELRILARILGRTLGCIAVSPEALDEGADIIRDMVRAAGLEMMDALIGEPEGEA